MESQRQQNFEKSQNEVTQKTWKKPKYVITQWKQWGSEGSAKTQSQHLKNQPNKNLINDETIFPKIESNRILASTLTWISLEVFNPILTTRKILKLRINKFSWTHQRKEITDRTDTLKSGNPVKYRKIMHANTPWSCWGHKLVGTHKP